MNSRGCRQSLPPLPDLSRKIEGDSVRRVIWKAITFLYGYLSLCGAVSSLRGVVTSLCLVVTSLCLVVTSLCLVFTT